ncbi:glycosyltransferase 87 family protein [Nocardioides sp. BP30]|uniref:glycosyltransferase 87 family protein n=1 Tax=Nocardioides sp. BP30 TaxID=3036374 RepID=UPI002469AEBD|nr:glycosyltransferase 87 family protein [Nocardioides sp. BP30]WGL54259.1 glycosyltransferase 87 family protein [Nocardioides sp. BP30]
MVVVVVAAVAIVVRVAPLLRGGGLLFWGRYDDGVYFTASASLLAGRVPYREFVLLHPPLIMLLLLPFTLLGRLTSDPTGLLAARLTWVLLGTLTAVLAARFAGRWGTSAALVAGLWVACSASASYASQTTFIEPAADLALFGAVALLSCDHERPRHELAGGVLLGIALAGKIWYVVPVAAVLLVLLAGTRRGVSLRTIARAAGAAAVTATAILLPFFALAPRAMWRMVVLDQLSRPRTGKTALLDRLGTAIGGRALGLPTTASQVVAVVATVAFAVGAAACLLDARARMIGAVAVGCVGVLLLSPVVFHHYGDYTAAPVAATVAIGWSMVGRGLAGRLGGAGVPLRRIGAAVAVLVVAAGGVSVAGHPLGRTFPRASLTARLPAGCITADDPTTLVLANRLSSDLRHGCAVAVDVTGASYGASVGRGRDVAYLDWLHAYLRSGAGAILARRGHDGLPPGAATTLGAPAYTERYLHVLVPEAAGSARHRHSSGSPTPGPSRTRRAG